MGTDLFALRKSDRECIDSYQIWSDWRDFIWPECLQNFWWKIHDYNSAQICIANIRKYYPSDIELIRFADWLEKMDIDIIFELSI